MAAPFKTIKINKDPAIPVAAPVTTATQTPITAPTTKPVLAPTTTPDKNVGTQLGGFLGVAGAKAPSLSTNTGISETGAANNGFTGLDVGAKGEAIDRSKSLINYNGQQYINYGNGVTDAVNTPEELTVAGQLNNYEANAAALAAQQAAELGQNQSDFNYANDQLNQGERVASDRAQQYQNRFGGLYSGGLNYQQGGIDRSYGEQRGQLAQQFQRANQALNAKYGAQTGEIRNNINNLLTAAPGLIQQAVDQAAAAKAEAAAKQRQANLDAALNFTDKTGYLVNPQDDYSGFYRQVQQGATLTPDKQLDIAKFTEDQKQNLLDNNLNIQKFEEDKRQFGLDYAIKQNSQSISEDANLRQWAELDYKQSKGGAGSGEYAGLSPNQLYEALSSNYTVQDPTTKKNRITSDPAMREQLFLDAIDASAGMTDAQVTQLLTTLGLRRDEIEQFEKKHTPSGK